MGVLFHHGMGAGFEENLGGGMTDKPMTNNQRYSKNRIFRISPSYFVLFKGESLKTF